MAKRDIQIVLKRFTDKDLESFSIRTQHNKITATQRNRKRKRDTEMEAAEVVCDSISKNTRSRAQNSLGGTNTNTISTRHETKRSVVGKPKPTKDLLGQKESGDKGNSNEPKNDTSKMSCKAKDFSSQNVERTEIETTANTSTGRKRKRETKIEKQKRMRKSTKLLLSEQIDRDSPSRQYLLNEIILTTIPGFVPWPSRILKIDGHTILVEFFGTGQRNLVRSNSISGISSHKMIPYLNRKGYRKAVLELEKVLKIPSNLSLFLQ